MTKLTLPEATMTGSRINSLEIGHLNSSGKSDGDFLRSLRFLREERTSLAWSIIWMLQSSSSSSSSSSLLLMMEFSNLLSSFFSFDTAVVVAAVGSDAAAAVAATLDFAIGSGSWWSEPSLWIELIFFFFWEMEFFFLVEKWCEEENMSEWEWILTPLSLLLFICFSLPLFIYFYLWNFSLYL